MAGEPLLCGVRKLKVDVEDWKAEVMRSSIPSSLCPSLWQRAGCEHCDFLSRAVVKGVANTCLPQEIGQTFCWLYLRCDSGIEQWVHENERRRRSAVLCSLFSSGARLRATLERNPSTWFHPDMQSLIFGSL